MERIKNSIQMHFVAKLESLEGLSDQLAFFETIGSWKDLFKYSDKISQVEINKIPNIVKKYFDINNGTIVE